MTVWAQMNERRDYLKNVKSLGTLSQDFRVSHIDAVKRKRAEDIRFRASGYIARDGTRWGVRIYHRLIVSFFTVFNIALHFIYRKRREGKPCEV